MLKSEKDKNLELTEKTKIFPQNQEIIQKNPKNEKIFILTKKKKSKNWTKDEDKILTKLAFLLNQKSWIQIAKEFPNITAAQCRARCKRIRPSIIKGTWSKEEDDLILFLEQKNGKNWALISKFMTTRNGKQIRDRFLNYLDHRLPSNQLIHIT